MRELEDLFETQANSLKIIPWDASVGGLIYSDNAFSNVPREHLNKLQFFQPPPPPPPARRQKQQFIRFQVHNKIVDGGLFDDYRESPNLKRTPKKRSRLVPRSTNDESIPNDAFAHVVFTSEPNMEFVREQERQLQYQIDAFKNKLNNDLRRKYNTELLLKTPLHRLPRYIFIQRKTVANSSLFQKKLFRLFLDESALLYRMAHGYRTTEITKDRLRKSYMRNIRNQVLSLERKMYVNLENPHADVLVIDPKQKSPFGRMYWYNPKRRYDLIVKSSPFVTVHRRKPFVVRELLRAPMTLTCRKASEVLTVSKDNVGDASVDGNVDVYDTAK